MAKKKGDTLALLRYYDKYGIREHELGYLIRNGRRSKTIQANFSMESKQMVGCIYTTELDGVTQWCAYIQVGSGIVWKLINYTESNYLKLRSDLKAKADATNDESLKSMANILYAATFTDINHVFKPK